MSAAELLGAVRHLDPDVQVTITVRAGDLAKALEVRAGGPEVMSTTDAARVLGHNGEWWRRAAERGLIEGAWQDAEAGPWSLPRASCEAHIRSLQRRRLRDRRTPRTADATTPPLLLEGVPRGPRKHGRKARALRAEHEQHHTHHAQEHQSSPQAAARPARAPAL